MTCFHPIQAYSGGALTPNGKKLISFGAIPHDYVDRFERLDLPCGSCVGCRLERSRQWAVRIMHEAQLHERNCFVTLSYSDDNLPVNNSLVYEHFRDFMKRLRSRYPRSKDNGIRFFHCGEYSPEKRRPHYHAIIFNFDFDDRVFYKKSKSGFDIDTSDKCDDIWSLGHCFIGDVSFGSAAYVARYIVDKVSGDAAVQHYCDKETGEVIKPEYTTMSRRPGIGKKWFEKFGSDVYPSDNVIVNGLRARPPRYYDSLVEVDDPELLAAMKAKREVKALKYSDDQTPRRLREREKVRLAELNLFKRS